MIKKTILLIICTHLYLISVAQNQKILDSLNRAYHTAAHDTTKALLLTEIALQYRNSQVDTCAVLAKRALQISEKTGFEKGKAQSFHTLGIAYQNQGDYPRALDAHQKSLKIREALGNKQGVATSLGNIGVVHRLQGNLALSLEYSQKGLKIREEIGDKKGVSASLNNIGIIYDKMGNYVLELEYYQKSLKIREEIGDKQDIALSLTNIGGAYFNQKNLPLASIYYEKSFKIAEEIGDKRIQISSLNGLSRIVKKEKNYDKSIEYAQQAFKIAQELRAFTEISTLSQTLYEVYKLKKDYVMALEYHELYKAMNDTIFNTEKSKVIANLETKAEVERKEKEIELLNKNRALLEKDNELQRIENERQRNARLALEKQAEAARLFSLARQEQDKRKQDSLMALATQEKLEAEKLKAIEQSLKADNRAKMLEIAKEKEAKQQQLYLNYLVLAGFFSILLISVFIYNSRQKEKQARQLVEIQNKEINQQKEEILQAMEVVETQKTEIQKKNEDIIASINYALRIQNATLPTETELQKYLDCFVLFRPRDIVSGDFYWFANKEIRNGDEIRKKFILAVADCTGHGVSGAFMTMIGHNILNQIVNESGITEPDEILNQMPLLLGKSLSYASENVKDGMDIAIITIESTNLSGFGKIAYAGAMNPLYYVQNGKFKEIKADKHPIDGQATDGFIYQKHILNLSDTADLTGLTLYLCSDGFQDQFGGTEDKKFMTKKLKNLLFAISDKPLAEQKNILDTTFDEWKGNSKQTDDVCLIGIRL